MPWNNQGGGDQGGPWGSGGGGRSGGGGNGNGGSPWGSGGGGRPPQDFDKVVRQGREAMGRLLPGGGNQRAFELRRIEGGVSRVLQSAPDKV